MKSNLRAIELLNIWLIKKLYERANESLDPKLRKDVCAFSKKYIKDFHLVDKIDDDLFKKLI